MRVIANLFNFFYSSCSKYLPKYDFHLQGAIRQKFTKYSALFGAVFLWICIGIKIENCINFCKLCRTSTSDCKTFSFLYLASSLKLYKVPTVLYFKNLFQAHKTFTLLIWILGRIVLGIAFVNIRQQRLQNILHYSGLYPWVPIASCLNSCM